jgi:hypothetical protein
VAAGQVTREGANWSRNPHWMSPIVLSIARPSSDVAAGCSRSGPHSRWSFGECLACGAWIGLKRLEAVPWTEYCVACQDKLERGELLGVEMSGNDMPSPEFRFRTRNRSTVKRVGRETTFRRERFCATGVGLQL